MSWSQNEAVKVGIVGGGPRGLFCLERIALELRKLPVEKRRAVEVTLFETSQFPGAGTIYDPNQPRFLLMNYPVRFIDIWSRESRDIYPELRTNLYDWLTRNYPEFASEHGFVPRALVGEYLHEGFRHVIDTLPEGMSLKVIPAKVEDVTQNDAGWIAYTKHSRFDFDEVVMTVGHEGWRPVSEAGLERSVFPVERQLSVESVPPDSKIAVRGFSLTFIDAVLALTEMRGGQFSSDGIYDPSGGEPRAIIPFSRTGRPMLPKPDYQKVTIPGQWGEIWKYYRQKIEDIHGRANFSDDIMPLIFEAADEAVAGDTSKWFQDFLAPTPSLNKLKTGYDVATGNAPADEGLALAEAWRNLYPDMVRVLEHGGLSEAGWPSYLYYSTEMERIAFGPSAINVGKMLSLVDKGILLLDQPLDQVDDCDQVIDARIPSPTSLAVDSPLRKLLQRGSVRWLHGNRGIEIGRNGDAIDSRGRTVDGLAIVGRVTEGCVIGNDTLSRTLNQHIDRWARTVANRHYTKPSSRYEYSAA
ncbi:MAG: FAD/NAD(P)-binding protein [Verrucomicrobiales bacterium]|nr:FAD/NAD(P)-binding protein [Verrucomicrobiales bacterium]